MRLLLAEDDLDLAEALSVFFEKNMFSVDTVHDGMAALDFATLGVYDALILDVMMPKMDGISLLKMLRQNAITTPVMMLTAKAEKNDRVVGFDAGADDYLPKPFSPDELLSRVRAMLRRKGEYQAPVLSYADLELDCTAGILRCAGKEERLSNREFQMLELFMRQPSQTFSAERIMERIWGFDSESEINVVWVHLSNLRKKLYSLHSRVKIRVNRGIGYFLEAQV